MVPLDDMNIEQLDESVRNILTAYSYWLRDTNIPKHHETYLAHPDREPKGYLKHGSLKEYLSKAINLLRKLIPDSEFWEDEEYISDISGASFERGCKRRQLEKQDTFGEESKIGLYFKSRNTMGPTPYAPHWTFLISTEGICKSMLGTTKHHDTFGAWTEKRCVLVFQKHAVGRGSEAGNINIPTMFYDAHIDTLVVPWPESKTVRSYLCPFVPNKEGYATDVLHSLGTYAVCGKGLHRTVDKNGKKNLYLFREMSKKQGSGSGARWLNTAIRNHLPDEVPTDARNRVCVTGARSASITGRCEFAFSCTVFSTNISPFQLANSRDGARGNWVLSEPRKVRSLCVIKSAEVS